MKKLMSLVALAVVGSVVASSAQEVLSANAVGYIKKTIEPGNIEAIVYPFEVLDGTAEDGVLFVETQIATDLPGGSQVHFWNAANQSWDTFNKSPVASLGWLGGAKTKVVQYGEMFFVQPAKNATGKDYTLAGEVPASEKTVRRLSAGGNLDAVGVAYPTDQNFVDTEVAKGAPGGSQVHFWNPASQGWDTFNKSPVASLGWLGAAKTKVLEAGEGFFIQLPGETVTEWEQTKPYTWP